MDEPSPDLESLLVEHLPYVRQYLRLQLGPEFRARESVSDLVQSVCREVLSHPARFRFLGERAFRSWLCSAAFLKLGEKRRYHSTPRRSISREQRLAEDVRISSILTSQLRGPVSEVALLEERDRIERVFDRLDERQRSVLFRRLVLGMTHAEIAEELGISEANSRRLLSRANAAFIIKWNELGFGD